MQTRIWVASAATVALLATGVIAASPIVHGQAATTPPSLEVAPDPATLARDIGRAVEEALAQAGLRNGELGADLQRTIAEATRNAQEAMTHLDVDVMVDDAMQDMPVLAMLGGRPRIGVSTRDVTPEEANAAGLAGITGAFVSAAPADSAAGKAGLLASDIIVSVDGETIRSARQLARVIGESPDGRALQITYVRGTAKHTVTVTPAVQGPGAMSFKRPGPDGEGPVVHRFERRVVPGGHGGRDGPAKDVFVMPYGGDGPREFFYKQGPGDNFKVRVGRGRLGVMAQPLTDQLATYFAVNDGVLVTQVTEASPAAKAGIKAGDVITAVDGKPVKDTGDILEHLDSVDNGKVVPVAIVRDKKAHTISVTLEGPSNTSGDRPVPRRQRFTA